MTTYRHFTPKGVRAWNVEALAQGTPDRVKASADTDRQAANSIPAACEARKRQPKDKIRPGLLVRVDGRWYRVVTPIPPRGKRGQRFEIEDLIHPGVKHEVTASEITHVSFPDPANSHLASNGLRSPRTAFCESEGPQRPVGLRIHDGMLLGSHIWLVIHWSLVN